MATSPPDLIDPEIPMPSSPPPVAPPDDDDTGAALESDHVPSSAASVVEPDCEQPDYEHSLPTPEEVRSESIISHGGSTSSSVGGGFFSYSNKHDGRKKRLVALVAIGCLAILILGVSFGTAAGANKGSQASTESSSSSSSASSNSQVEEEHPSVYAIARDVSRLTEVQNFLSRRISARNALQTPGTPQYEAALWIADKDIANLPIPTDPNHYDTSYAFVERYIMAVFYFALGGAGWKKKMFFMSEKSVCDWRKDLYEGSVGDEPDWKLGVQCDENDAITHIFMSDNRLEGELPVELGDLLDLYHFSLYKNSISGNLPQRMESLKDMKFIGLESNKLTGSLPTWLNKLSNLKYLALGSNELTGPIPDLTGMTILRQVSLEDNRLTGNIHNFKQATALESLFLARNEFSGRIHDATLDNLEKLVTLDISNNYFTGYFPQHFYLLEQVDVHRNMLTEWQLPEVGTIVSPLEFLSVHSSGIPKALPADLGKLKEMRYLDLSNNDFTGEMPEVFGSMTHLHSLYLSNNDFIAGTIPDLRPCTSLRELGMSSTNRNGRVHGYFGTYLTELELIDFHNNTLTGPISTHMGELQSLSSLYLNRNLLSEDIPSELGNLPDIVELFLDNNNLGGTANPVCDADPEDLAYFVTDCVSEVTCECCTLCCSDSDPDCNTSGKVGRSSSKTIKMLHEEYLFSEDLIFRENIKNLKQMMTTP